jgi:dipeptidase
MISVGKDEYCTLCNEWREYDDNGKCLICGKVIKKIKKNSKLNSDEEQDLSDFNGGNFYECDESDCI